MFESLNKPAHLFILIIVFALTACGEKPTNNNSANNKTQADAKDEFVGCYTINKDTPAQIKISKNVNPKLDSDFVVHIFGAVNTIYAVDCDDKQIDIVKTER